MPVTSIWGGLSILLMFYLQSYFIEINEVLWYTDCCFPPSVPLLYENVSCLHTRLGNTCWGRLTSLGEVLYVCAAEDRQMFICSWWITQDCMALVEQPVPSTCTRSILRCLLQISYFLSFLSTLSRSILLGTCTLYTHQLPWQHIFWASLNLANKCL